MPVIAVVNRKGGSGKSTLATHIAGYCANHNIPVMLGDVDRQQSTQTWLKLRGAHTRADHPPILGWAIDPKNVLRAPPGVSHVVLDTAGGLRGFELARIVGLADAILMPVCNSVFDRESASDCYAELMALPRVASGRCKVAAVGMRVDARTKGAEILAEWASQRKIPFVGVLRDTQAYVRCVERGLTLFDLPATHLRTDLAQWQAILQWLEPILHPPVRAAEPVKARVVRPCHVPTPSTFSGLTSSAPIVPASAPRVVPTPGQPHHQPVLAKEPARAELAGRSTFASRFGRLLDLLPTGRALHRGA
jgi:chromosome partitioning protein